MVADDSARTVLAKNTPVIRMALARIRKLCSESARLLSDSLVGHTLSTWGDSAATSVGVQKYIQKTGQLLMFLPCALQDFEKQRQDRLTALEALRDKSRGLLRASSEIDDIAVKLERALTEGAGGIEITHASDGAAKALLAAVRRAVTQTADASKTMEDSHSLLLAQAEQEADHCREVQERVGRIAQDLTGQDPSGGGAMDLEGLVQEMSRALEKSQRALQFDDLVSQLIGDLLARMDTIQAAYDLPPGTTADVVYDGPVHQETLEAGSVELF